MKTALYRSDIEAAVGAACLAPSILNVQPWRFVARSGVIEVHLDSTRLLPAIDPIKRALTISCGSAVFNLRLAIAAAGRRPDVVLLPDGQRSSILAAVSATNRETPGPTERRLFAAIPKRRTSRVPYVDEPLPPELVVQLEDTPTQGGASFHILTRDETIRVTAIVREADTALRADSAAMAEIASWIDRGDDALDGIPAHSLGPKARDPSSVVRDFAMGERIDGRRSADFERFTTMGVLVSSHDEPHAWMEIGQLLEQIWLEATAAGLAVSLLTQPLEVSVLRALITRSVRPPSQHPQAKDGAPSTRSRRPVWPQAILRIGVAERETRPTPRRRLADVLTFA